MITLIASLPGSIFSMKILEWVFWQIVVWLPNILLFQMSGRKIRSLKGFMFFSSGDYGGNRSHPVTVSYERDNRRDSHLNLRVMAAASHMSVGNEEGPYHAGWCLHSDTDPSFPCQYDKLTPNLSLQRKRQEQYLFLEKPDVSCSFTKSQLRLYENNSYWLRVSLGSWIEFSSLKNWTI